MSTTSTILHSLPPGPDCPGPITLERAIVGNVCDEELRCHLDTCPHCREQARLIRDNLAFMSGIAPDLVVNHPGPSREGELLSGYSIIREIARGGQGVVFEAIQLQTKRRAAIKMIEPDPDGSFPGNRRRRIEREAELVASLRHPNIVSIYHCSPLPGGRFALAMEYVDGVSIDAWAKELDARASPSKDEQKDVVRAKLRAMCAICDAVHHAHINGVIHRDLKPGNVLIDEHGTPRVVDFGVALRTTQSRLTRAGGFTGTLAYASPEQVSGDPDAVDARSDVYALGVMLYELLAGRPPYDTSGSLTGVIEHITRSAPAPLLAVQPGSQPAGAELEAIVAKALSKDRSERYQSAAALKEDLEHLLNGLPVSARAHNALYLLSKLAARHRVGVIIGSLVLALLVALGITAAWSSHRFKQQGALLAASLSSSTIERGRLVGMNGANARAEELIWPEFIRSGARADDPDLLFEGTPSQRQAAWALVELYSRSPSQLLIHAHEGAEAARFEPEDPDVVRVVAPDASEQFIRISKQAAISSRPGDASLVADRPLSSTSSRHVTLRSASGPTVIDLDTGSHRSYAHELLRSVILNDVNPDGTHALSVDDAGTLRLWSLDPLVMQRELATNLIRQAHASFSPDGTLITCGRDEHIVVFRSSDGAEIASYLVPESLGSPATRQQICVTRFSPDNRFLAAGVQNHVVVYDTQSPNTPPRRFPGQLGYLNWIDFSADGSLLASCSSDRTFRVYDVATGEVVNAFEHGEPFFARTAFSPDGSKIALLDTTFNLRVFEVRAGAWRTSLHGLRGTIHAAAFTPDGSFIVACSSGGELGVWRAGDHHLVAKLPLGASPLLSLVITPDSQGAIVADQSGTLWQADLHRLMSHTHSDALISAALPRTTPYPTCLACSPNGSTLVVGGTSQELHAVNLLSGGDTTLQATHAIRVVQGAFAPDGRSFVSVGGDGVAIVSDPVNGAERFRTPTVGVITRAVCFAPDGKSFFTGSDDWKIRQYDASTGSLLRTISGAKQHVFALALHPSGNILFSCGRDSSVQVWDTHTGRELAVLQGHTDMIMSLALSPDGRKLLTASADQSIGVWDLDYYLRHLRGNETFWRRSVQ
jgi:WD40 repeat protein/serine/threonine protein kinase